jgi:hypothetical protein
VPFGGMVKRAGRRPVPQPVIFATQVSALDGLNAAMAGWYAMC